MEKKNIKVEASAIPKMKNHPIKIAKKLVDTWPGGYVDHLITFVKLNNHPGVLQKARQRVKKEDFSVPEKSKLYKEFPDPKKNQTPSHQENGVKKAKRYYNKSRARRMR